jgi:hypothetical protein
MCTSKLKVATAVLLAVGLIAGAGALARQAPAARGRPVGCQKSGVGSQKPGPAAAKPTAAEKGDSIEVSGRVVDPDGKPFAGAKVFFARYILALRAPPPPAVTSDAEGRFRLRVSRTGYQSEDEKAHWLRGAVVALAKGDGHGGVGADNAEKLANVTVKLVKEVPIAGRVVDLQGKPIAGVRVRVLSVSFRADGGDLKGFVEALRSKQVYGPSYPGVRLAPALLGLTRPAVTGADGKFRLTGLSGERLVGLRFEGPTIETADVFAMTRPAPTIVPGDPYVRFGRSVFHGATFDHAAAPTRPVVGVVRDKDTGKPLAGVTVQARIRSDLATDLYLYLRATTDAEGRYRLVGLSREGEHRLQFLPGGG